MSKALLSLLVLAAVFADSLALLCYGRTASSSSTSNGTTSTCTTETACYSFVNGYYTYAGCGACSGSFYYSSTTSTSCTSCNTDYCNTQPSIKCYTAAGFGSFSASTSSICYGSTQCYKYTLSSLFYAGCGGCNSYGSYCTPCSTDNCNSASAVGVNAKLAAAAAIMLLAVMKFF